jgi:hypothetical protein
MSDPFAKAPEFLAAFDHVRKNGFFESIQYNAGMPMSEGPVGLCSITATGCVPDEAKYAAEGCGVLIDPDAVVESCKLLAKKNKVRQVHVTIKTENWNLWDESGNNVVGRKGARTTMVMNIQFEL